MGGIGRTSELVSVAVEALVSTLQDKESPTGSALIGNGESRET